MRSLILGGARSGKSRYAERLLGDRAVTYVATGAIPDGSDPEWEERVRRHRSDRPVAWTTVETHDLAGAIGASTRPVLVDCLGAWLARVVDQAEGWEDVETGRAAVATASAALVRAWTAARVDVVLVSNEVGLGVVPGTASGMFFRDELGRLNAALAGSADRVHLVMAGRVLDLSDTPSVS